MDSRTASDITEIQHAAYAFPYHYIPQTAGFPKFARSWGFSASYLAALKIVSDWLAPQVTAGHLHVDFGCGDGALINTLSKSKEFEALEFLGVDYDKSAIKWAKNFALKSAQFTSSPLGDLQDEMAQTGTLIEVYEHIKPSECQAFLALLNRKLRPGGSMLITVPSKEQPLSKKHYRHFDVETLKEEFSHFFRVDAVFGFERKGFISKIIHKMATNSIFYLEFKGTSNYLVAQYAKKYLSTKGCYRLGMVITKAADT